MWKAWRAARGFGVVPEVLLALLTPHLDALAQDERRKDTRASQREQRWYALFNYYHEVSRKNDGKPGAATTLKEARARAAKRAKTTEKTVEQWILESEGRGQRGARR